MLDTNQMETVIGRQLLGGDGAKIGTIGQIYVDDDNGRPEWATVQTGLFGTKESFVPLVEAALTDGGVTVPYSKDKVKGAPNVDDSGHLSEAEERELYAYYGIPFTSEGSTYGRTGNAGTRSAGHDTSGPDTDDAMTRSEEQLRVGTERVEAGKARLRKYVVTENVTKTVPVRREELRVEREPITDANRGAAMSGGDITEEEHEVVLTEERAVVSKETVPVERVRLGTETVTEEQRVDEEVRKERIELDDSEVPEGRRNRH